MSNDWRDRLLAYDEPDLDPTERAALDKLLDELPAAREFLNQLRRDRELFRSAFGSVTARDGFVDAVMARVPQPRANRFGFRFPFPRALELCAAAMLVLVTVSVFSPARDLERRRALVCQQQVKDLTQVVMSYAADYDDRLPAGQDWGGQLVAYGGAAAALRCPSDDSPLGPSYAMPLALAGAPVTQFQAPDAQPVLFDARGPFLVPRHDRAANVGYLDGSVRQVTLEDVGVPSGW